MCVAIPVKIIEKLNDKMALTEFGGTKKEVSIELLDDVNVGDYVIIHVGYALSKINEEEAIQILHLFEELR